jgi:hypothetical protein
LIYINAPPGFADTSDDMEPPKKPPPRKEAPRQTLSRLEEEARRVVHDYAEALRQIIKKLRQRLN